MTLKQAAAQSRISNVGHEVIRAWLKVLLHVQKNNVFFILTVPVAMKTRKVAQFRRIG